MDVLEKGATHIRAVYPSGRGGFHSRGGGYQGDQGGTQADRVGGRSGAQPSGGRG